MPQPSSKKHKHSQPSASSADLLIRTASIRPSPSSLRAARYLKEFSERTEDWIDRRSERIAFDSEFTVQRKTTLEVVLDQEAFEHLPRVHGRLLLPVGTVIRKANLSGLRLDYEGTEMPLLRREQQRMLLGHALTAQWLSNLNNQRALLGAAPEFELSLHRDLLALVLEKLDADRFPPPKAKSPESGLRDRVWKVCATLEQEISQEVQRDVLLALLPVDAPDLAHFFVSEEHTERVESVRYGYRHRIVANGSHAPLRLDRSQKEGLFYPDTYLLVFQIPDYSKCKTYHLEIQCPPGLYRHAANLCWVADLPSDATKQKGIGVLQANDNQRPDQVHVYHISNVHAKQAGYFSQINEWLPIAYRVELRLVIRPTYHSGLRSAQNMAVVSTVSLGILAATTGTQAARWDWLSSVLRTTVPAPDGIVSFLLLAPIVVLSVVLIQNEHPFSKRTLSAYRTRVSINAIIMFAAALAYGIGVSGVALLWWLFSSTLLSGVLSIYSAISTARSRKDGAAQVRRWATRRSGKGRRKHS